MSAPANKVKPATKEAPAKTPAEKEAEKALNFKRIAEKRVPKIVKAIRGLQPLASPNYSYTPEQARKIITALETELIALSTAFERRKSGGEVEFSL
jgi:hypothetical protein